MFPFFLVNRRFAFNKRILRQTRYRGQYRRSVWNKTGDIWHCPRSACRKSGICVLTTLPALAALSAAFEIGEPAVQTAVSDAGTRCSGGRGCGRDTGRFSADISECGIYPSYGSTRPVPPRGRAFCRKLFQQGRTAAAAQNFNISGFA